MPIPLLVALRRRGVPGEAARNDDDSDETENFQHEAILVSRLAVDIRIASMFMHAGDFSEVFFSALLSQIRTCPETGHLSRIGTSCTVSDAGLDSKPSMVGPARRRPRGESTSASAPKWAENLAGVGPAYLAQCRSGTAQK